MSRAAREERSDLDAASGCLFWMLAMALVWALAVLALISIHFKG